MSLLDDIRKLLLQHVQKEVEKDGKYLEATVAFSGEICLKLHDGRVSKGSAVMIDFDRPKVHVKVVEE
jgi:hemerythrin superfamily protein